MTGRGTGLRTLPNGRAADRGPERGGCLLRLVFLLVIAGAALSLAWMALLPLALTRGVRERTGFDAEVASLSANPFTGRVTLRGLVLTNPPTFPNPDCLQLRGFEAAVDIWSLFRDRLVIDTLTVDVRQLTLVKRSGGATNLQTFRTNLAGRVPTPAASKSPLLVRKLHLRFDTLVLADYTEAKPRTRSYRLGLDQEFRNISTPGQLFVPAVLRGLAERDVGDGLAAFLPPDLSALLGDAAKAGENWLKATQQKTGETFRGFLDKLEETRKP